MPPLDQILSPEPLLTEKARAFAMRDQFSRAFQSGTNCVARFDALVALGGRMAPFMQALKPGDRQDFPFLLECMSHFHLLAIGILEHLPPGQQEMAAREWSLPGVAAQDGIPGLLALAPRVRHLCEVMDGACAESLKEDGADFWPNLAFPAIDRPLLPLHNFNPDSSPARVLACRTLPEGTSPEGLRYVQLSGRMLAGLCRQYQESKGAGNLEVQATACQAFLIGLHRYSHHRQQDILNLGLDALACPAWVWQAMWNRVLDSGLDTGLHDPFNILVEQEALQANVAPAPENLSPRTARRL